MTGNILMTLSKPVVVLFVVGCSMCFAGEQETITHSVLNVAEPMLIDHGPVIIQRSRDSVLDIPFSSEFQTAPAAIENGRRSVAITLSSWKSPLASP